MSSGQSKSGVALSQCASQLLPIAGKRSSRLDRNWSRASLAASAAGALQRLLSSEAACLFSFQLTRLRLLRSMRAMRFGLRVDRLDGLGQAGQAVHAAYQDAGYAPALQLGEDVQPELGALAPGGPHPQRLPAPLHSYRQGQADRPVGDLALAPRLGHGRVEVDDRVRPLQRRRWG